MDPIDLKTEEGRSSLISLNKYKIDDSTEKSIYDYYAPYVEGKTSYVADQLNRRLIWETNSNGLIKIEFIIFYKEGNFDYSVVVPEYYRPEQLVDQFALLGAIHSFYKQNITKELIDKMVETPVKRALINKWEKGEIVTIRDFLVGNDIKFTEIDQMEDKSFMIIIN